MKFPECLLLLLLTASTAWAAPPGLNLSWDDCGAAGALNRDFACDTNQGSHALVGSLVAPEEAELVETGGFNVRLRVEFASAIPDWWQLQSGGCRETGDSLSLDFGGMTSCENRWVPPAVVAIWGAGPASPSVVMMTISTVLDPSQRSPLVAGAEYYLFRLVFNNQRTTGANNCIGCQDSARITFYHCGIDAPGGSTIYVLYPSTRNYVLWQQGAVPVRGTTWAEIKRLYR